MWEVLDWVLVTAQNVLTVFGFMKQVSPYTAMTVFVLMVLIWLALRTVVWAFFMYDENGPTTGQVAVQVLITGGTLLSPLDIVPDVVPAVGLADDISLIGLLVIGVLSYLRRAPRSSREAENG